MSSDAAPAIDVARLTRRFGARVAIEDVTFSVGWGETLVLLGPNGAGKTTTLRVLAGVLRPSAGRVAVAGVDVGTASDLSALHARVGLLTETPGLWDRLSVEVNLLTYARLHGVPDPVGAVRRALEHVRMADRAADLVATLSKGLRQRVSLARALLHAPRVVLLDEPTSGLDPAAAKDVRETIGGLRRDGNAVVVCTHNLSEAEQLADRVGVVKTRLLALAAPAALRRSASQRSTVVVSVEGDAHRWLHAVAPLLDGVTAADDRMRGQLRAAATTPDVVSALVSAGARVTAVHTEQPSLEQVYLSMVEDA